MNVSGGEIKVCCYKEQYCIRTWTIRSMNQGVLDMVKQHMSFTGGSHAKEPTCQFRRHRDMDLIPGVGRSPGEGMYNILTWRIPWTEETGGLQSMRLQRVKRD